jgi:hypothetical protein
MTMKYNRKISLVFLLGISIVTVTLAARAEEPAEIGHRTLYSKIWEWKTYKPGKTKFVEHSMQRAGNSYELSPRAAWPKPGSIQGYWVGGGHAPLAEEGTWGWDKTGTSLLPRSLRLGYSHGRLFQGGTGSYNTDRLKK